MRHRIMRTWVIVLCALGLVSGIANAAERAIIKYAPALLPNTNTASYFNTLEAACQEYAKRLNQGGGQYRVVGSVVTTPAQYQSVTSGPYVNGLITAGNYQCRLLAAGATAPTLAGANGAGFCGSKFVFDGVNPYGNCACPSGSTEINGACHAPNLGSTARAPAPVSSSAPARPQACQSQGPTQFGNPVHGATGNKYQSESDYASADGALRFERHYNSQGPEYGRRPMGALWRHSYDARLERITDTLLKAYRANGQVIVFAKSGTAWNATAEVSDRLSETATGFSLINGNEDIEYYNLGGQLSRIQSPSGQELNLIYSDANTASAIAPLPGLLIRVEDSFARALSLRYDENLRIVELTDSAGNQYTYGYDANENLTSVSYPDATPQDPNDNPKRLYHYEDSRFPNALTGITDENGTRFATYAYDAQARAISSEHAGGVMRYLLSFNADGSSSVTDPLNTARSYSFQTILGAIRNANESQPCPSCGGSNIAARSFDANGNVSAATDFNGNQSTYVYDLARNLELSRTEAAGTAQQRSITTEWHPNWRLPTKLTEPNRVTEWSHDAQGNVLTHKVTDSATGLSRSSSYTYNAIGQVLTADGPRTDVMDVTTYTYYPNDAGQGNKRGMLASVSNALGHTVLITDYDAHGRALSMTDANGLVSSMTYDARGRLTSRTVGSETTVFEYDGAGQLIKVTLPDASFVRYSYDAAHRLTQILDHLGNKIVYTLDAMGNRTREDVYFPNGTLAQTHSRTFDALNRLHQEIGALNQTTTYSYDSQGNLKTVTDPLGRATTHGYDALNRMNKVTDALSGITLYDFDANDRIRQVTDPRGLATVYSYNGLDDLLQQLSPDTGTTHNTYDSAGNLATTQDARGEITRYSYDALNRVSSMSYGTTTVSFTYDQGAYGRGRLTGMTDATGATTWEYDAQGRLVTHTQRTGATLTKTMRYAYNNAGQLISLTYPSGRVMEYVYSNGQVSEVRSGAQVVIANIQYQPFGPARSWTWGNGTGFSRAFDSDGRIASHSLGATTKTLGYDPASRIQAITDSANPSRNTTYGYDELDRLINSSSTAMRNYSYDGVGNRLTQSGLNNATYSYAANSNRLLGVAGSNAKSYSYDAAGNTTADGVNSFTYDARGRQTITTTASGNVLHGINALGQRVYKSVTAGDTVFYYAPDGKLLAESDAQGTAKKEYLYLGDQPIALWAQTAGSCINSNELRVDSGTTFSAFNSLERLEVRGGKAGTADWEVGLGNNTQTSGQFVNGHLNWVNNKVYAWTLTYNGQGAATITVTDNATTVLTKTWNQGMDVGNALKFYVKSSAGIGAGNKIAVTIDTIQGQAAFGTLQTAGDNFFSEQALHYAIPATGAGMTITGAMKLTFTGSAPPTGSRLNFTATAGNVTCQGAQSGPSTDLYYVHADHLNTPRSITTADTQNKEVWRWENEDAFGDNQANEDPDGDGTKLEFNLRFPGQYFDKESKTHYNYHRDYEPSTGRYIQSDPIGLKGGLNTYAYVHGSPTSLVDPLGLRVEGTWIQRPFPTVYSVRVPIGNARRPQNWWQIWRHGGSYGAMEHLVNVEAGFDWKIKCTDTKTCKSWEIGGSERAQFDIWVPIRTPAIPRVGFYLSLSNITYSLLIRPATEIARNKVATHVDNIMKLSPDVLCRNMPRL